MDISIEDLLVAFRKTKVDMYYSCLPCREKLLDFEEHLEAEILKIKSLLEAKDLGKLSELCTGYLLVPKKLHETGKTETREDVLDAVGRRIDSLVESNNFKKLHDLCKRYLRVFNAAREKKNNQEQERKFEDSVVFSDPAEECRERPFASCELRLVADTPVAFHVIMTWWILKIGEKLERTVSDNAYGNRIRRHENGEVSQFSLGTFKGYLKQYQTWHAKGLDAIRDALEKEKRVIAVTADFESFYHSIDAAFLLDDAFYETLGNKALLNEEEREYTELVVGMLQKWAAETPLGKGLPVGCSISAVVANLALHSFDDKIEKHLVPLYYGRYVDDVILVLENPSHLSRAKDVWTWLATRLHGLECEWKSGAIFYSDSTLCAAGDGKLAFQADKTRIILMEPGPGEYLLDSLERQIKERSSEWRSLPVFPEQESELASKMLSVCDSAGKEVDSLRKIGSLSRKRASFAMFVRDFEAYGRNLLPEHWRHVRMAILKLLDKRFTDIKSFFDLQSYYFRILAVACHCINSTDKEELELLKGIVVNLFRAINMLGKGDILLAGSGSANPLGKNDCIACLGAYLARMTNECFSSAANSEWDQSGLKEWLQETFSEYRECLVPLDWRALYRHDLAYQPARIAYTRESIGRFTDEFNLRTGRFQPWISVLPNEWKAILQEFVELYCKERGNIVLPGLIRMDWALAFPVKPLNTFELTEVFRSPLASGSMVILGRYLQYSRGFGAGEKVFPAAVHTDHDFFTDNDLPVIKVEWSKMHSPVTVALANWGTSQDSRHAAVCKVPDPDMLGRYNRLMRLVNELLSATSKMHLQYLVFPELSIPWNWFAQIALKLKVSGISLIAGVEYIHEPGEKVRNQVWCSLLNDGCGFPQISVCKFEKARPAVHEAEELWQRAKRILTSDVLHDPHDKRPIVCHGKYPGQDTFIFSVVICSDLTNVAYRSQLRGKIDALFVPSWNQDEEVFASLVEAAAYDIHAYVIQCNDRAYGGTRIRVPGKERYKRDIMQLKGGELDYFVIGKMDVEGLRRFQSFPISPVDGPFATFKPVPSGFSILEARRVLPQ